MAAKKKIDSTIKSESTNEQVIEQSIKLKGRGGVDNFGNSKKALVKTEKDREFVSLLLSETLVAYKMPRVTSDEELKERLSNYFITCAETGQIPTVEEMALTTGYSSATLWDWENGRNKGFTSDTSDVIKKAKEFLKAFDAKLAVSGKLNFLTYCFRAKNWYGMVDKQEHVIIPNQQLNTSDPDQLAQRYNSELPELPSGDTDE